jgi:hypothetical protein
MRVFRGSYQLIAKKKTFRPYLLVEAKICSIQFGGHSLFLEVLRSSGKLIFQEDILIMEPNKQDFFSMSKDGILYGEGVLTFYTLSISKRLTMEQLAIFNTG